MDRDRSEAAHKIYLGAAYHSGKRDGREEEQRLAIALMAKALGLYWDRARDARIAGYDIPRLQALVEPLERELAWPAQG